MNDFDVALLVFAAVALVLGVWNGLVRLAIGLGALVLAFVLAARYHDGLAGRLPDLGVVPEVRRFVAYGLVFLAVMLAASLLAWIVRRIVHAATLGWIDRLGGGALGLLAATLCAAFVIVPLVAYAPAGRALLADSRLAPYVAVVAEVALSLAPPSIASRFDENAEELRRGWRERLIVERVERRTTGA